MTVRKELADALEKIAYGYLLLHLDFNIASINVLPDWLSYAVIVYALTTLAEEEPTAELLRPLGYLLITYEVIDYVFLLFGKEITNYGIQAIIGAISLYFHFQLLTNIAAIAEKYESSRRGNIIKLRSVRTILLTIMTIPFPWKEYEYVVIGLVCIGVVVCIWICVELFSLKNELLRRDAET